MAHLGPGLQGIKETGWEKVLFAPATANFPAQEILRISGAPIPVSALSGGLGSPDPRQQVPWGQEPRQSQHPRCGHTPQSSSASASPPQRSEPGVTHTLCVPCPGCRRQQPSAQPGDAGQSRGGRGHSGGTAGEKELLPGRSPGEPRGEWTRGDTSPWGKRAGGDAPGLREGEGGDERRLWAGGPV